MYVILRVTLCNTALLQILWQSRLAAADIRTIGLQIKLRSRLRVFITEEVALNIKHVPDRLIRPESVQAENVVQCRSTTWVTLSTRCVPNQYS